MPAAKPTEPRAGLQTTEFWLALAVVAAATVLCGLGKLDADQWSLVAGVNGAGYAIGRGLAKRGA